jgi:putative hydrolase of the HAD superfamily
MNSQYVKLLEDQVLTGVGSKGEASEYSIVDAWRVMLQRLQQKEYTWDEGKLGDIDELALKVAFFFHRALQGITPAPCALETLSRVAGASFFQGLIGDGQAFSLTHLLRGLQSQGPLYNLGDLFTAGTVALSYRFGVRQPAPTLFTEALEGFKRQGLKPAEILYISPRVHDELVVAKKLGFRTALYAGDKASLRASSSDMKDAAARPDRILTSLPQLRQILEL